MGLAILLCNFSLQRFSYLLRFLCVFSFLLVDGSSIDLVRVWGISSPELSLVFACTTRVDAIRGRHCKSRSSNTVVTCEALGIADRYRKVVVKVIVENFVKKRRERGAAVRREQGTEAEEG